MVSHSLTVTYKGKRVDARAIGRELNVRYLVEGEIRTADEQVVVKARLIDTSKATEVWSDEIRTRTGGSCAGPKPTHCAADGSGAYTRWSMQSGVAFLRSRSLIQVPRISRYVPTPSKLTTRNSLTALAEARKLFDQALQRDPTQTGGIDGQALTYGGKPDRDPHADHDRLVREYEEMSARVVAVAGRDARAWNIRADALQRAWRWEAALEANARAQKSIRPASILSASALRFW